jgi:hypothetical protein
MSPGMRAVRYGVGGAALAAALWGAACEGPLEPRGAVRVFPDTNLVLTVVWDSAWAMDTACGHLDGAAGWRQIAWFSVPSDSGWVVPGGDLAGGEFGIEHGVEVVWLPDMAYVFPWFYFRTIRHEMLHVLLYENGREWDDRAPELAICGVPE